MSKNDSSSNRTGSDIWICSQCKTFFETKRKLLTHLEGTCKLNPTEIRLRDLKYNRISVLGPKSITRTNQTTAVANASGDDRSSDSSLNQQELVVGDDATNSSSSSEQRKRERFTIYEEINESLYKWFLQAKKEKLHLSGPILQDKAKEIAKQLGTSEFKASNGWLHGFKKRKGIAFNRTGFPIQMDSNTNSDSQTSDDNEAASPTPTNSIYTDQVENLRMYNLRPVNPDLHIKLKKDEFNNYSITNNGDCKLSVQSSVSLTSLKSSNRPQQQQHNQSLPASTTLAPSSISSNQTRRPNKLIIVHSKPTTTSSSSSSSSALLATTTTSTTTTTTLLTSAAHKLISSAIINGSSSSSSSSSQSLNGTEKLTAVATVTSTLLKYSNNKDLPQIKYYGSLRNNSNFSKQCMVVSSSPSSSSSSLIIMNGGGGGGATTSSSDQNDVTKTKSTHLNLNQTLLGKRSLPNQNSGNFCPRILPKSSRLQQQQQQQQQQLSINGSKSSTLIDISSDEEQNTSVDSKESLVVPATVPSVVAAPSSIQYGIPIIDFSDEETVRKCFQNGIKSFMPLKGLNIKDKSDLYLPILQIQDIEKRNFIPTNRYLSIGSLKTFTKS